MKLTQEHAFHAAGIATTGFAAHAAVTYLQTVTPDIATAYGFSAAISAAVYYGWKFTLTSKTKKRGIPLLLASLIMTAISGYTVYQSSVMPLQAAAIAAAAATDAPRKAEYDSAIAKQAQTNTSLLTSITDLRKQNEADQQALKTITGKSADWKKQQLRNTIENRNTQITDLQAKQAAATPPTWEPTKPAPLEAKQTNPLLARAFAFELIMVMFMLFARFARHDEEHQEHHHSLRLTNLMQQAENHIRQLETLFRHAEKCRNDVGMDVGMMSECKQEGQTPEHLYFLLKNRLIQPNKNGNFPADWIMEKSGVGERKAKQLADDWCNERIIERIKSGRGYTYRYPETNTSNVIPMRRSNEH